MQVVHDLKRDLLATEDRIRADLERRSGDDYITIRSYYVVKMAEVKAQADSELQANLECSRIAMETLRGQCDQRIAVRW